MKNLEELPPQHGYPQDDANSLHQGYIDPWSVGKSHLSIYYACQFVSNETTNNDSGTDKVSRFLPLAHGPISEGSLTGTIYRDGNPIQYFDQSMKQMATRFGVSQLPRP